MRILLSAIVLLTISACTSQMPVSTSFTPQDPGALFMFGTAASRPMNYSITYSKYDAENLRLDSSSFKGQHSVKHKASGAAVQYHAIKVEPGSYVLKSITVSNGYSTTIICLSSGTFRFDLLPGQVTYVGNILFGGRRVDSGGFDMAAAKAALAQYPNVEGEITKGALVRTSFRNGKDLFGTQTVCGGYYVGELEKPAAEPEAAK